MRDKKIIVSFGTLTSPFQAHPTRTWEMCEVNIIVSILQMGKLRPR